MTTLYENDVAAWAQEQVALLRAGKWALLDIDHLAEEIEDMNVSHRHQLAHRMAILLGHLLKWQYQPTHRGSSWEVTIKNQRDHIAKLLRKMPSLRPLLDDAEWDRDVWNDAVDIAVHQANLKNLLTARPWRFEQILSDDYFPS